jgi:hypothetical protein
MQILFYTILVADKQWREWQWHRWPMVGGVNDIANQYWQRWPHGTHMFEAAVFYNGNINQKIINRPHYTGIYEIMG